MSPITSFKSFLNHAHSQWVPSGKDCKCCAIIIVSSSYKKTTQSCLWVISQGKLQMLLDPLQIQIQCRYCNNMFSHVCSTKFLMLVWPRKMCSANNSSLFHVQCARNQWLYPAALIKGKGSQERNCQSEAWYISSWEWRKGWYGLGSPPSWEWIFFLACLQNSCQLSVCKFNLKRLCLMYP